MASIENCGEIQLFGIGVQNFAITDEDPGTIDSKQRILRRFASSAIRVPCEVEPEKL